MDSFPEVSFSVFCGAVQTQISNLSRRVCDTTSELAMRMGKIFNSAIQSLQSAVSKLGENLSSAYQKFRAQYFNPAKTEVGQTSLNANNQTSSSVQVQEEPQISVRSDSLKLNDETPSDMQQEPVFPSTDGIVPEVTEEADPVVTPSDSTEPSSIEEPVAKEPSINGQDDSTDEIEEMDNNTAFVAFSEDESNETDWRNSARKVLTALTATLSGTFVALFLIGGTEQNLLLITDK